MGLAVVTAAAAEKGGGGARGESAQQPTELSGKAPEQRVARRRPGGACCRHSSSNKKAAAGRRHLGAGRGGAAGRWVPSDSGACEGFPHEVFGGWLVMDWFSSSGARSAAQETKTRNQGGVVQWRGAVQVRQRAAPTPEASPTLVTASDEGGAFSALDTQQQGCRERGEGRGSWVECGWTCASRVQASGRASGGGGAGGCGASDHHFHCHSPVGYPEVQRCPNR